MMIQKIYEELYNFERYDRKAKSISVSIDILYKIQADAPPCAFEFHQSGIKTLFRIPINVVAVAPDDYFEINGGD